MKILNYDFKKGFCKIKVENLDDLWVLSQIIDSKDHIRARTLRKIKLNKEDERKSKIIKKAVTLTIEVEKVEFNKDSNTIRISGKIKEGPEDIPINSYHTIEIEENSTLTITKDQWFSFQIEKLKDSASDKRENVLICVMDRDEACFALIKKYGYEYLSEIKGKVQKKGLQEDKPKEKDFYQNIITILNEYVQRYSIEFIIIASPAFWKDDLIKIIKQKEPELIKKITLATCNAFGRNAINEVLKRPEVTSVLKQERIFKETELVEELLREIAKDNLAVYGLKETKKAAESGAIKTLLITDKLIHESREKNEFEKIDLIMKNVDKTGGKITLISEKHDAGKKLQGLGGIGGLLRYKINY